MISRENFFQIYMQPLENLFALNFVKGRVKVIENRDTIGNSGSNRIANNGISKRIQRYKC